MIGIQNQMGKELSPLTAVLVHQRCCQSPMGQSTVTPGPLPVLREYLMERGLPASPGAEGAPPGLGELVQGAGERGCNWGGAAGARGGWEVMDPPGAGAFPWEKPSRDTRSSPEPPGGHGVMWGQHPFSCLERG